MIILKSWLNDWINISNIDDNKISEALESLGFEIESINNIDPNYKNKLDYSNTVAFENFDLYTSPLIYEFSTIDFPPSHIPRLNGAEADYFTLFEFSAKWDPVPTMLTQNHVSIICLLYTSPSPRDGLLSRMPSSA